MPSVVAARQRSRQSVTSPRALRPFHLCSSQGRGAVRGLVRAPRSRPRVIRATCIAVATIAAVAGAFRAPAALASQVAVVTASGISVADTPAGEPRTVASGEWVDVAYAADGRLLATRTASEEGCELVDLAGNTVVAAASGVLPQIDRSQGLCEVASAPAGGILFGADNLTASSSSTYHLDLAQGTATLVLYGYGASQASTGATVAIQHRYFRHGGSYEQPWLLPGPGKRPRPLSAAPKSGSGQSYSCVAISRDGRAVAATRSRGTRRPRDELVSGSSAAGLTKVQWRLSPQRRLGQVEFLPDGSGLLVSVATSSKSGVLYRTDRSGNHRTRWLGGVRAFAVN